MKKILLAIPILFVIASCSYLPGFSKDTTPILLKVTLEGGECTADENGTCKNSFSLHKSGRWDSGPFDNLSEEEVQSVEQLVNRFKELNTIVNDGECGMSMFGGQDIHLWAPGWNNQYELCSFSDNPSKEVFNNIIKILNYQSPEKEN